MSVHDLSLGQMDRRVRLERIGKTLDRLMTLDLWCKFAGPDIVLEMYKAALDVVQPSHQSLSLAAAERIQAAVQPGSWVMVCTGLVLPPWMVAETDGPPGAAALARMLNLALNASSAILVPPRWVGPMRQVAIASGMTPLDQIEILNGQRGACAILPFPTNDDEAKLLVDRWMETGKVAAVIALETPGRNEHGRYVTGAHGFDISAESARFDILFEVANQRGIPTVGIGDHGGELGLGTIASSVKKLVPTALAGSVGDITPVTRAAIPVVAGISNWGAYAIAGAIAAVADKPDLVHDGEAEARVLRAAADAGFLAGMVGLPLPIVDGISSRDNSAFVDLVRLTVRRGMQAPYPRAVGFNPE